MLRGIYGQCITVICLRGYLLARSNVLDHDDLLEHRYLLEQGYWLEHSDSLETRLFAWILLFDSTVIRYNVVICLCTWLFASAIIW